MPDALAALPHLALLPGLQLERTGTRLEVRGRDTRLALGEPPEALTEALARLAGGGAPESVLEQEVERRGGPESVVYLYALLERLTRRGLLRFLIHGPDETWLWLEPLSPLFSLAPRAPEPRQPLRLSRFAHVRREGEALVLESPRVPARVVLCGAAALPLLAPFARPVSPSDAVGRLAPAHVPAARAAVELLARAGFLLESEPGGATEEERTPALAPWEFHDLLFHTSSRRFLHGRRRGATWRLRDTVSSPPVVPPLTGPVVPLPRPDLERLTRGDPPLADVMERRRSLREPGPLPITREQLGELLFRCARVREVRASEHDEVSSRPYPSGGARYPLELYATVRECVGLEPGLYRYDAAGHQLEERGGLTPVVEALLTEAQVGSHLPQVLLILSARFARTSFKYESIAYSLILKEAGVLLHSLSLAATAMRLTACLVGRGNPDTFERAAGLDGASESSVGELVLGGPPFSELLGKEAANTE